MSHKLFCGSCVIVYPLHNSATSNHRRRSISSPNGFIPGQRIPISNSASTSFLIIARVFSGISGQFSISHSVHSDTAYDRRPRQYLTDWWIIQTGQFVRFSPKNRSLYPHDSRCDTRIHGPYILQDQGQLPQPLA